ncbi:MAG: 3-deoxy-D-manno-octulosonic acid transferase, partial [Sphingobacteriales bacterium]
MSVQILLYNLFLWLYGLAIRVVALFDEKAARWIAGRKNLYKELEAQLQTKEKRIWFHCASVGEFEQARPLIERLRSCHPSFKIVLTFFSPSGYELRKDYPGADYVFYLPMDGRRRAARFVRLVNPSVAVFVKYEFWYHYLRTLKQSKIPVILVAAAFRPSQPFFQWYGGFFRRMLGFFNHLFVHDK